MSRPRSNLLRVTLLCGTLHLLAVGCSPTVNGGLDRADYEHLSHPAAAYAFFRDATLGKHLRDAWETLSAGMRREISYATFSRYVRSTEARPVLDKLRRARFLEHRYLDPGQTRTEALLEVDRTRYRFPMVLTRDGWRIDIDPQQLMGSAP